MSYPNPKQLAEWKASHTQFARNQLWRQPGNSTPVRLVGDDDLTLSYVTASGELLGPYGHDKLAVIFYKKQYEYEGRYESENPDLYNVCGNVFDRIDDACEVEIWKLGEPDKLKHYIASKATGLVFDDFEEPIAILQAAHCQALQAGFQREGLSIPGSASPMAIEAACQDISRDSKRDLLVNAVGYLSTGLKYALAELGVR